jgi:outer membrane protein assembly factor BamB
MAGCMFTSFLVWSFFRVFRVFRGSWCIVMKKLTLLAVGLLLTAAVPAAEPTQEQFANWHQWRGPLANGVAPNGDPPVTWDDKTNIKWKTAIPGRGTSTPIVWGDQVFVLTAVDTGRVAADADLPRVDPKFEKKTEAPKTYFQFVVMSLDRKTGEVRWKKVATEQVPHEGHHPTHCYAAGSPYTDGKNLYVSFGSRGVYCYGLDGELKWRRDLGKMQTRLGWGEANTPVLTGDVLIVNWDQEVGSFIAGLDAKTGDAKWKVDRDDVTTWNTPLVVEHKGRTQLVVNATKKTRSYDAADGKLLWECGGQVVNCIPSPVAKDGVVFCMSGYKGSLVAAISLDATGDVTGTDKVLWKYEKGTPYVPSPLLLGDRLYFTQLNNALLTSLDVKTGKPVLDRERLPGLGELYASPVAASGRIYLTDRDGTTLVLKAGDRLDVLATNRLGDPVDASPVVVGKQLFLRGQKYLYCIEEGAGK